MEHTRVKCLAATLVFAATIITYIYYRQKLQRLRNITPVRRALDAFNYLKIIVVTEKEQCEEVMKNIRSRCSKHHAVGFDCEWVTGKSGRKPVSLLQLSTYDGYCALFRLHLMETIPQDLIDFLADRHIYKVGVAPHDDAKYLRNDYDIDMQSSLDVRHFAHMCGQNAAGLGTMSQNILHVLLDKSRRTRCSDWEATTLTPIQRHYAASDAHAAILIFVKAMNTMDKGWWHKIWNLWARDVWYRVDDICEEYADITYKVKHVKKEKDKNRFKGISTHTDTSVSDKEKEEKKDSRHSVRSKPLYDNCYMYAPDGELLCTCDTKKALWYVQKELADIVSTEKPMGIRLRFEPSGRSVGDVGRYYQIEKENKCVVCGRNNSFIRKNVVPREYRKYFPEAMKEHSSHDVLLLCVSCHRRSNATDQRLRDFLAKRCNAPLPQQQKFTEDSVCKAVRMSARALLANGRPHRLPEERIAVLSQVVLQQFPEHTEITEDLLQRAANLTVLHENQEYTGDCHGMTVVAYFMNEEDGLLSLEALWRRHFLDVMQPRYLPELWSVTHNKERLQVKYKDGRLTDEDLKSICVKKINWDT